MFSGIAVEGSGRHRTIGATITSTIPTSAKQPTTDQLGKQERQSIGSRVRTFDGDVEFVFEFADVRAGISESSGM